MDIVEAIRERRSIRAFKPDPVPQQTLVEIMELAQRAPSWANTQPWEFAIVCGEKLEEIKQAYIAMIDEQTSPDLAAPRHFPEPFDTRRRVIGRRLFEVKGISRKDEGQRRLWRLRGTRLFGAPAAIYIYTDYSFYSQEEGTNVWPVFDCGLIAENIMLLATNYGLGTIPQIQAVGHPDVLREILDIPDSKLMVLGIAIGYPDWDDPTNIFRSERDPLSNITRWYGFD